MVLYFERNLAKIHVYQAPLDRHLRRLNSMVVLSFVEAFERFLKELAASIVDLVAPHTLDDRLGKFQVKGAILAAHFEEKTLGRAVCESSTWLDCREINGRFRDLLARPFVEGNYELFKAKSDRRTLVDVLWQLRHSIVHNAGVITKSDALKLRLLTRRVVDAPRMLAPTRNDTLCVKLYLDRVVKEINREVAGELCQLMTTLLDADATLFDPAIMAQAVADRFGVQASVANIMRNPQPTPQPS